MLWVRMREGRRTGWGKGWGGWGSWGEGCGDGGRWSGRREGRQGASVGGRPCLLACPLFVLGVRPRVLACASPVV